MKGIFPMNTKRLYAGLLSLLMLTSGFLASCSDSNSNSGSSDGTTAPNGETTTAAVTEDMSKRDEIPETNLDGLEIKFLVREEVDYEFVGEDSGDILSNVIYQRDANVSERFNVKLTYHTAPGLWNSASTYQALVKNSVLANDGAYDIVTGQSNIVMPLALEQLMIDVSDPDYIDFSKPYWKSGYTDNVKINGKLFTLCGDYALTTLTMSNVLIFNKNLLESMSFEIPYDSVRDGTWTVDKYLTIANTYEDSNGNGENDINDIHGFSAYNNYVNPFMYASNVETTKVNTEGKREIDFPSERAIDICNIISELCHSDAFMDTYNYEKERPEEWALDLLKGRKLLTTGATLSFVEYLRDMEDNFGIVPYPKYDETQDNYRTSVLRRYTVSGLPITSENSSASMLVLEAMASEGYNEVIPTYYEIALKDKYARDTDTAEMLDIISSSAWFDFADAYYPNFATLSDFLGDFALYSTSGVASSYASASSKMEQALIDLYALFE